MNREAPGLYLHLPFCSAICPYCDFSVVTGSAKDRRRFVEILVREIDLVEEEWSSFDTIYLGGGTPSLLALEDLEQLLTSLRSRFGLKPEIGISCEANPEDVATETLVAWREMGMTTLSLGVQSFDDERLAFLGRRHDSIAAKRAVELAMGEGFETVSIDLMFGLPGPSTDAWRRDLAVAIALAPDHISCYQLTVHRGTAFWARRRKGELKELATEEQARLFFLTHELLGNAGFEAYEVSNFARAEKHRSRHNMKYWHHVPYLGLGPSAHSFDGRGSRWWNERRLGAWQAKVQAAERPLAEREELSPLDLVLESVMLGLRTIDGIDLHELSRRCGFDLALPNRALVARLTQEGLLFEDEGKLKPTTRGLAVADSLAAGFHLPDASSNHYPTTATSRSAP